MKKVLYLLLPALFMLASCGEKVAEKPVNGFAMFAYADSSKYEGNWVNGERQGQGKIVWTNGCSYEGVETRFAKW